MMGETSQQGEKCGMGKEEDEVGGGGSKRR